METPIYLRRRLLENGAETITGTNVRPRSNPLPGAPFIAVVFNGRGRVLDWFSGTTEMAAADPALAAYAQRDAYWTRLGEAGKPRVSDPPVWQLYELVDGRYRKRPPTPDTGALPDESAPDQPRLTSNGSGTRAVD